MKLGNAILSFVLALAPIASAKAEDTQNRSTNIGGSADAVCLFSGVDLDQQGITIAAVSPTSTSINISNFVDQQTSFAKTINFNIHIKALCNFAHEVSLVSNTGGLNLQNGVVGADGFITRRDYSANLSWAGQNASFTTSGVGNSGITMLMDKAATGSIDINISAPAGNDPLVQGDYLDFLTININGVP